jgi:hypothetical protein
VAHRETLNDTQVAVLRWIADGCREGVMDGDAHRISEAALRSRGLVRISGRGRRWTARVTDAGRAYLKEVDGSDPPVPRQANVSVTQQLVDDVIAAGGSLRVPRPGWPRRGEVDWENRAHLAAVYGKVPAGKRLAVTVALPDELQIELVDAAHGAPDAAAPVPVPAKVGRHHPVVRQFRERAERHEVSRAALPRALRILQGLVVEAERRGYRAELAPAREQPRHGRSGWSGSKHGHVLLSVGECTAAVRVTEDGLPSRAHWEYTHRSYSYGPRGRKPVDAAAADRVRGQRDRAAVPEFVTGCGGYGRPAKWADRQSWALDDKLPELLQSLRRAPLSRRSAGGRPSARRRSARARGRRRWSGRASGTPSTCAVRRCAPRSPSGITSSRSAPTATPPRPPTATCPRRPSGSRGRAATPTRTTRCAPRRGRPPPPSPCPPKSCGRVLFVNISGG